MGPGFVNISVTARFFSLASCWPREGSRDDRRDDHPNTSVSIITTKRDAILSVRS